MHHTYIRELRKLKTKLSHSYGNVHDLRVSLRKIQAALLLVKRAEVPFSVDRVLKKVRRQCRGLNQIRELEVGIQDAKHFHLKIRHLKRRLGAARTSVKRSVRMQDQKSLQTALSRVIAQLEVEKTVKLKKALKAFESKLTPWKERELKSNQRAHLLRLKVKRMRYILEALGEQKLKSVEQLQNHLGRIHDLDVLQKLASPSGKVEEQISHEMMKSKSLLKSARREVNSRLHS